MKTAKSGFLKSRVRSVWLPESFPSTNPTSTTIYKALIALKGRNAIVFSPHPSAVRCISETARLIAQAAEQAGAPPGIVGCMSTPTMEGTQELMKHRITAVILATGGPGLVRAAYSAGKPAFGVGPGNAPPTSKARPMWQRPWSTY